MVDSGAPFSISAEETTLTYEELSRAMQVLVDAEHEAHRLYRQIARSTDKEKATQLLKDVAGQERFYAESVRIATNEHAA